VKKWIYYYESGDSIIVQGSPEIKFGRKLPIKKVEIEMKEETFKKWTMDPKKYQSEIKSLTQDASQIKKDQDIKIKGIKIKVKT